MGVAESKGRCDLSSKYYDYFTVQRFSEPILGVNKTFSLKERYVLEEQLGWGQFGVIRTCRNKITGEILACKSIAKDRLMTSDDVRSVKLEIEIMTKLSGHPNVVDLKDVFEEEDYVHLVMELCAGGELFHQLEKHGQFSESDARAIFKHLMQVVLYCHENGVVHRDLKPENILLATKASPSSIKLADFGLATYIKPGQSLQGIVGSPFYIAPEVLVGDYNQAADVWSAGVILYILLSGMPPFWGKTKSSIFDAVKAADLQFPSDPWDRISESARTLIQGMLCVDPSQRLSAQEVLDHSWMEDPGTDASTLKAQDNRTSGECKVSEDSFSSSYVCRDHDISFGTGSYMICDTQSPKLSCWSSFSSFFVEPMTPCTATRGGFSFGSYENSNNLEFCSPVSSMPSFAFSPGTSNEEGTIELLSFSQVSHSGSILGGNSEGTLLVLPSSVVLAENKGLETEGRAAEVKTIGGSGHGVPCIHSKRNRTIGLGECQGIDIIVTESVTRWSSCTVTPTSIVC
ncbi:hypothetical protein SAY87_001486 [Trapa incisa]|uniref:non-specific serine/threonine protein kinase n=1 Tax=Trapa incisa TaxID=236973 RepID=A0AAN7JHN4_9MYRT|nr:hypothetical protein SAY87_001486 [Trapa incisa]